MTPDESPLLQVYSPPDQVFVRGEGCWIWDENGDKYLDCIAGNMKPGGKAALQFISIDHRLFDRYAAGADFIQAYIFPGGMLLDEPRFEALARQRGLSWDDRDAFGLDYARTLNTWRDRYDVAVRAGRLSEFGSDFHNLWRYYLMYCEGGFRGRGIDVAQVTLRRE